MGESHSSVLGIAMTWSAGTSGVVLIAMTRIPRSLSVCTTSTIEGRAGPSETVSKTGVLVSTAAEGPWRKSAVE